MSSGLEAFTDYRAAIDDALAETFREFPGLLGVELSKASQDALVKLQDYSLRPGKRIRGSLAAAAYDQAVGEHLAAPGIQLAVALELVQNYLLIIDDVMDKSTLRRGEPTIHELYMQQGDSVMTQHEAQMMAVTIGVIAQHMASLVIARISLDPNLLQQAMQRVQINIAATAFGQLDDLYQQVGRNVTVADIIRKYQSKSSYYTFINPLECGLTLAGQSSATMLAECQAFGLPAGVAFQLHDDYLGIFADAEHLGKPNLDDIREGKYTLLMHYALTHAQETDKEVLRTVLGNAAATPDDLEKVRAILERSGAKNYVVEQTAEYARAAGAALGQNTTWQPPFVELLQNLVTFSIERSR